MPTITCKGGCGTTLTARTQGGKTLWLEESGIPHVCPKAENLPKPAPKGAGSSAIADLIGRLETELRSGQDEQISSLRDELNAMSSKLDMIDAGALIKAVDDKLAELDSKREIRIIPPKGEPKDMGRQHRDFGKLVQMMASRRIDGFPVNVWATGPAGGGKTAGFLRAFEALGCTNIEIVSLSQQTSKSDMFGYRTATGEHIESAFHRVYTEGGGILWDEFDNANANAVTLLNAAFSNGIAGFPMGTVKRHPDSYFAVAGNTFGLGPDGQYIGRAKLDAATRRRFAFLHWGYDWSLFSDLLSDRKDVVLHMEKVSKVIDKLNLEAIASPAQCIDAVALMDGGMSFDEAFEAVLWAPMKRDDREKVKANLK